MVVTLTIVRYPKRYIYFGFLSMAVFPVFLWKNSFLSFYKLMGCGRNGTFDIRPDLRQWAILAIHKEGQTASAGCEGLYGKKIAGWWKRFQCEVMSIGLEPIEGHGTWEGKECFGSLPKQSAFNGLIGVLTRASIRVGKARSFWKHVPAAAADVKSAPGYITSFGIGELPWIRQATFSVWENKEAMKTYAYRKKPHQQVIEKTRKEKWFREEMFVRFRILWTTGTLNEKNEIGNHLKNENGNMPALQ